MTRLNIPLFVALAATLLSATDARDQLPHQRMIRKRGPAPLAHFEERAPAFVVPRWPGLVERQDPPVSSSGSVSASRSVASSASASSARETSSSAQASSAAVTPSSSSASVQSTLSASSSSQSGLLDSLTAVLGGSQSSTSAASSTSASSSSSSSVVSSSTAVPSSASSVAPSTSQAAATTPVAQPSPSLNLATTPAATAASSPSQSVAVIYSTASSTPEAAASQAAQERTRKITKNTIISLVVIASCIGGAIAIWTVIRKWKLSPSERFDDRMQPIDWAPTGGAGGVRDDPLAEKASHRRAGSAGSHGSFTSGGVGQSELGHGGAKSIYSDATGHGNGNAQYGAQAQDFPPPHDFTAGAATGAYGQYQGQQYPAAGYADLRRGPSVTESNYSHGTYSRGPAYEAQPGAAGVPPMPTNPYGGYEEEYYQPAQGQTQTQGQGQYRGY